MTARWDDPAIRSRARDLGGVMAAVREARRLEAEHRARLTLHPDTRAHREQRCDCWAGAPTARSDRGQETCPVAGKLVYASPQEAALVQGKHARHRRWRQGLNVYQCGGHWHTGRWYSRVSAWGRAA